MKNTRIKNIKGFYFTADASLNKAGVFSDVKKAVSSGVCAVQYRNKNASTREMFKEALRLRKICRNALFIINDRVDIAQAVGADGVHLGQDDMPVNIARKILGREKIIGLTVHSLTQAKKAQRKDVDYFGVGPVFFTRTKTNAGNPVGLKLIAKIKGKFKIPIVAIGGINLDNAQDIINSGADALSAIKALVSKKDIGAEIGKFLKQINSSLAWRGVL